MCVGEGCACTNIWVAEFEKPDDWLTNTKVQVPIVTAPSATPI